MHATNEKGGSARRETALRMVSGQETAHEALLGELEDYRICSARVFTDLSAEP